jgi:hypothetical protein
MGLTGSGTRRKRRKCIICKKFFIPHPANAYHQQACSSTACQKERQRLSHQQWLSRPENQDHFRGKENVERVQQWRKRNPGYWKRTCRKKSSSTLQEVLNSQVTEAQEDKSEKKDDALQEVLTPQHPLLVGLISNLSGGTLQDDIEVFRRRLVERGCDILGQQRFQEDMKEKHYDYKTNPRSAASAAYT